MSHDLLIFFGASLAAAVPLLFGVRLYERREAERAARRLRVPAE